jgi:hypothetical protein
MILSAIHKHFEAQKGKPVTVKTQGNRFIANCPNPRHEDKNPSCVGSLITGQYKCLECGETGVVDFDTIDYTPLTPTRIVTLSAYKPDEISSEA